MISVILISLLGCSADEESYVQTGEITDLDSQIQALQEQIATLEESCATKTELSTLSETVEGNTESVSEIQDSVDSFPSDALTLDDISHLAEQTAVDANSDAIAALQTQNDIHSGAIDTLQTEVANNTSAIAANALAIATNQANITTNQNLISALQSSVTTLEGQYNTLNPLVQQNTTNIATNTADISTLGNDLGALTTTVNNTSAQVTDNTSAITTLVDDITALTDSIATITTDYVTFDDLDGQWIDEDTTWIVGPSVDADYPTLHDAVFASYDYKIYPDATLTLQMEPGTHQYTETVYIQHDHGDRLQITGDINQPDAYVLEFTGPDAYDGIKIANGRHVDYISGLTLKGDLSQTIFGLHVHQNSSVNIRNLIVDGWAVAGIVAQHNSTIFGTGGTVEVKQNQSYGVISRYGSVVHINDLNVHNNGNGVDTAYTSTLFIPSATVSNNSGFGVSSSWQSTVTMSSGAANNNGSNGYQISYGSSANLYQSTANSNGVFGYNAFNGGILYAQDASAVSNANAGYSAGHKSWIQAVNTISSGNGSTYNVGLTDDGYNRHITR